MVGRMSYCAPASLLAAVRRCPETWTRRWEGYLEPAQFRSPPRAASYPTTQWSRLQLRTELVCQPLSLLAYRGRCPDDFTDVSPKCTHVNRRHGPPQPRTLSCNLIALEYDRRLHKCSLYYSDGRDNTLTNRGLGAIARKTPLVGPNVRRGGPREAPSIHRKQCTVEPKSTQTRVIYPRYPGTGKHHPVSSHTDPPATRVSNFHHWETTRTRPCVDPVPAQLRTSMFGKSWLVQTVPKLSASMRNAWACSQQPKRGLVHGLL